MNKVVEFLNANPVQYLATVGRDGKAKCRPFMFAGELGGKLWFCANSTKEVFKDMHRNPNVELSVSSPDYAWMRLHGDASNPILEVFYLEDAHGVIADFSGKPPYEF